MQQKLTQVDDLPRMSPKYIQSIIAFKDFFIKAKQFFIKTKQERFTKSLIANSKLSIATQQSKENQQESSCISTLLLQQKEIEMFVQKNRENARKKALFEQKYNLFVDRIYGKMSRERESLEGIMNNFRKLHNQENNTRFLNHQERLIMDEISKMKLNLKKDNLLLRRLNKDFKREMDRDIDNVANPPKDLLKQSQDETQSLFTTFYHLSKSQGDISTIQRRQSSHRNNQESIRYTVSEKQPSPIVNFFETDKSLVQRGYYRVLESTEIQKDNQFSRKRDELLTKFRTAPNILGNLQIKKTKHSKSSSLESAKQILSLRKEYESKFQKQLEHERNYFKDNPVNPEEEQPQRTDQNQIQGFQYFIPKTNMFGKKISIQKSQKTFKTSNSQQDKQTTLVPTTTTTTDKMQDVKDQIQSLTDECKQEKQICGNIAQICRRKQRVFGSKYHRMMFSFNKL